LVIHFLSWFEGHKWFERMLIIMQVTMGKKNWKLPFCRNMSPENFPKKGIRCQKTNSKPRETRKTPPRLRILSTPWNSMLSHLVPILIYYAIFGVILLV
jgi:hypothetical protein